jgi:cytidine deaminase
MKTYPITEDQVRKMLKLASEARSKTYPKPNAYAVVVLTKDGNMYEGISYNSDTLTLTMHSEATALAHASIHGEVDVIAITGPNCHICKQLIWERSLHTDIDIQVVIEEENEYTIVPISAQMPYPWPDANGDH